MAMRSPLQDLRFLHMAKNLEEMFEGLEKAFDRHLPEGAVREALRPIFKDGPYHKRLADAYARLNASMAAQAASVTPEALLEAMLACERTAQRFYADHAADLSDPELGAIFRGLSQEEAGHARVVEDALRLQRLSG